MEERDDTINGIMAEVAKMNLEQKRAFVTFLRALANEPSRSLRRPKSAQGGGSDMGGANRYVG